MINEKGWFCVDRSCGAELGVLVGKELKVTQGNVVTDGPNLVVECPNCGERKVWYTSDTIVRAVYMLIDGMVGLFVARAMPRASRALAALEEKEVENERI